MPAVPVVKIKWEGRQVRLIGFGPRKYQLFRLARVGVQSIKSRVSQGIGSDDTAMPPLKSSRRMRWSKKQQRYVEYGTADSSTFGYARRKRDMGLKPIRDLFGPGVGWTGSGSSRKQRTGSSHMMDALRVTSASDTRATIDISTADARMKARANEQRAPWFGFSGRDTRNMLIESRRIWGENIEAFQAQFRGVGARANNEVPVWMDPLGISGRSGLVRPGFHPTYAGMMAEKLSAKYGRTYTRRRAA